MSTSTSAVESRKDALTSSDGVVGRPIDFDLASSIEGKESQVSNFFVHFNRRWLESVLCEDLAPNTSYINHLVSLIFFYQDCHYTS